MSYYGTNGPGSLVRCPDCREWADASFGDHGGECLDHLHVILPNTALGIIRKYAREHPGKEFSANTIRPLFDHAGVKGSSRGPAFGAAEKQGLIEKVGAEHSTPDSGAKGHDVKKYRSLAAVFERAVS